MINEHLQQIREFEAEAVIPWLPSQGRLLEIGAGAGWQARKFAEVGMQVFAIELADSDYLAHTRFPTIRYDGQVIPFADASFDVVYSSNVLEHVPHIQAFQREIVRVLRPGGRMIHVLPTAAWRIATDVTHYISAARDMLSRARRLAGMSRTAMPHAGVPRNAVRRSRLRALLPNRHGEVGNWVTETYYFSRMRWERLFSRAGLTIEACRPLRLFYTGYSVADANLSLIARQRLSRVFGSACRLFVLRQNTAPTLA